MSVKEGQIQLNRTGKETNTLTSQLARCRN